MRAILLAFVLLAAAFAGCTATSDTTTPTPQDNSSSGAPSSVVPMTATIEVGESNPVGAPLPGQTGQGMYLTAKGMDALMVGMPVNVTITNKGADAHDVVGPDIGLKSPSIPAGKSVSLTITPTKAGTFDIYCDIGQAPVDHRSAGMAGKATVKAAA